MVQAVYIGGKLKVGDGLTWWWSLISPSQCLTILSLPLSLVKLVILLDIKIASLVFTFDYKIKKNLLIYTTCGAKLWKEFSMPLIINHQHDNNKPLLEPFFFFFNCTQWVLNSWPHPPLRTYKGGGARWLEKNSSMPLKQLKIILPLSFFIADL